MIGPEQRVVLHFFLFKPIMGKFSQSVSIAETMDAKQELVDFLHTESSYADFMEMSAKAQAEIYNLITAINPQDRVNIVLDNVNAFFYNVHQLFDFVKPLEKEERL